MTETSSSRLSRELFADHGSRGYAVLDGASIPALLPALQRWGPRSQCLSGGALDPSEKRTAPYVVELAPDSPFTTWLTEEGWGAHWGIYLRSPADLRTLRKHLRTLLRARVPDGRELLFRFYDPRVLRVYLPTCNGAECAQVFGPIEWIGMEGEGGELVGYRPGSEGPLPV